MKILLLCSLFPPDAKGGAELSAHNAAKWLKEQGFDVAVLTTARSPQEQLHGELLDGFRTWKVYTPRPYPMHIFEHQPNWRKAIWHLQDHFDPRNKAIISHVIDQFAPDVIHVHLLTGLGYNGLSVLDKSQKPIIYFLHDLGLGCLKASMFKKGKNCLDACAECRLASKYKFSLISNPSNFTFVSPSADNLNTLASLVDLSKFESKTLANLDLDQPELRTANQSGAVQLLFVGRLHETKGLDLLVDALTQPNVAHQNWRLTVVGGGPLETHLRERAAKNSRINIVGRVAPAEVKHYMSQADILCVPSTWRENHPGVIRQALRAGVPVLVSNIGGAPEMVSHNVNGLILPVAEITKWSQAILSLIEDRSELTRLQKGAINSGQQYSVDTLGEQLLATIASARRRTGVH